MGTHVEHSSELLQWLLSTDNPSVRYWALQDIQGKPNTDTEVESAREALMQTQIVRAILAKLKSGGWWDDEANMYLPKYTASTHQLLILAELGAKSSPSIESAINHIFRFQRDSGHFWIDIPKTTKGRASKAIDGCCVDGNVLFYLNHFGFTDTDGYTRLIEFLVKNQDVEKGGWRCRAYPINPKGVFPSNCYMGAIKVLKGLGNIPESKRDERIQKVIDREVERVLENQIFLYLRNGDGSRKEKTGWKRFGFPLFYQSDVLEVLDILTKLKVKDDRMQGAIKLVEDKRCDDGKWRLENTFNGKMIHDIEEKGKPSKWITLKALRTLKRFYS
jgi:hypothetical protein